MQGAFVFLCLKVYWLCTVMFDHGFSMKIARDTGLKPCEFHVQIIWGLAREFFYPNHLLHFSIPDHWSLWMHKDQMVGRSYMSLVQTI